MDGFEKIEFTEKKRKSTPDKSARKVSLIGKSNLADQKESNFTMAKQRSSKKTKFKFSRKGIIALVIVLVIFVLTGIPAFATYKAGIKTYRDAKLVASSLKTQDIALASEQIVKTKKDLQETQRNFHYLIPLKFIPLVNFYYNDADHLMQAGSHSLDTAAIAIDALKPYADILGLKGAGSFTGGSAEDRIRTAVMAARKITPQIDEIGESLALVNKEMDKVDPNHYPTIIFGKKIKAQLTLFKQAANEGA